MDTQRKLNYIVMGDREVGKTNIILRAINRFSEYDFEKEDNFYGEVSLRDGTSYTIEYFDMSGFESHEAVYQQYFPVTTAFIVVFALNSKQSFDRVQQYLQWVRTARGMGLVPPRSEWSHKVNNFPVLLLGNKNDADHIKVTNETATRHAASAGFLYRPVSAVTNQGVTEAMQDLTQALVPLILHHSEPTPTDLPSLLTPPQTPPKSPSEGKGKRARPTRSATSGTIGRSLTPDRAVLPGNIGVGEPSSSTMFGPLSFPLADVGGTLDNIELPRTPEPAMLPPIPASHSSPASPEVPDNDESIRATVGNRRRTNGSARVEQMQVDDAIPRRRCKCCVML